MKQGFDYNDVLLVPRVSKVNSRTEVDLTQEITLEDGSHLSLQLPIIASPMKGIVGKELVKKMGELGGIGILHRFFDDEEGRLKAIDELSTPFGVAVGLNDNMKFVKKVLDKGATIICVDVANGYTRQLLDFCSVIYEYIKENGLPAILMAGNVATPDGVVRLISGGVRLIRVGIGSGGLCTTRNVTGVGIPQVTAIKDCYDVTRSFNTVHIVADGGIKTSGDMVKSLALGAKFVMVGSLLGNALESENDGIIYGMASRKLQEEYYHGVKSIEGIEKQLEKNTPLVELLSLWEWGMKSACTYMNAKNLAQLRSNAEFILTGKESIRHV